MVPVNPSLIEFFYQQSVFLALNFFGSPPVSFAKKTKPEGKKVGYPHLAKMQLHRQNTFLTTSTCVIWCLNNSITVQITNPVSAQDLLLVLISVLKSKTVSFVSAMNDIIFNNLPAEDSLVNQKPMVKIVEK
ncbi:hypothetical protein L208DRAFT_1497638 [Tricholoma matsutake]|nr:hypothetical protein L208DRAFT_1497638 [Tricholoma matsutake 945]